MNVLVTGGAGFIGSHTVVSLAEAGFNPVILDDFSNSEQSVLGGLEKILGFQPRTYAENCNDRQTLRRIFEQEKIDGVIHFAAYKAVGESMQKPLDYYDNNLGSVILLLQTMLEYGVSNLIFSSSCTVYGEPDTLPVTEETPVKPASSVYGNTKQIGEEIMHDTVAAGSKMKAVALRYFNPIGAHPSAAIGELPRGVPSNLVPFIIQTAAGLRESLTIFGDDYPTPDGTCIRDYIHVLDLAEAHVAALKFLLDMKEDNYYDIFNIGTGQGASVMELVKSFEKVTGQTLNYQIGPRRSGDVTAVYADAQKAEQQLGWKAQRSMEKALADAWHWQQAIR